MKKTVAQIILIIGALVTIIGIIVDGGFILYAPIIALNMVDLSGVAAIVAVAFAFSKKDTLVMVAYLILAITGACALVDLITGSYYGVPISVVNIGFVIMGVASIIYFLLQVLKSLGFVRKNAGGVDAADVVTVLNKYKEMESENIITAEEFDELKSKILKGADKGISSVDDLKKWKKLYDQKVITEDEFANVKGKILLK